MRNREAAFWYFPQYSQSQCSEAQTFLLVAMSIPSGGVVKDVLRPLLNRLDTVDHLFSVAASASELGGRNILQKLAKEMKFLEYWCEETWEKFDEEGGVIVSYLWYPMLSRIDEIRSVYPTLAACQDRPEMLRLMATMREMVESLLEANTRPVDEFAASLRDDRSIVSLEAHLTILSRLLTDGILHRDASEAKLLLGKIRGGLARLEGAFHEIQHSEKAIEGSFGAVQHLIDELLESPGDAPTARQDQLKWLIEALSSVDKEVAAITGRVNDSFRLSAAATTATAPGARPTARCRRGALEERSGTRRHLKLAMDSLETRLKRCLLCLAVFPEDAVVKKRLLIHWWIGEGLVSSVDEGKEVFDELVSSTGFVTPMRRAHCSKVHGCKVHPWIRVLLVACARSCAFLDLDSEGKSKNDFARTRRACLRDGKMAAATAAGFRQDVATIYNVDRRYTDLDRTWFARMGELTTLQLGTWRDHGYDPRAHHVELINGELLGGIGACRSLRYLSFRGISGIEALPDSIGNLCNLVILDLRSCHNLAMLSQDINSLVSLEFLDVSGCFLLCEMPKGIGKLSRLQVIKGFVVANSSSKDPSRLNELRALTKLRKLSIVIGRTARPEEDEFKVFGNLAALRSLTVTWGGLSSEQPSASGSRADAVANMTFSLPSQLEKLDLRRFPLPDFPLWADPRKLCCLEKLYVRGGMLSGLGEHSGWTVRVLRVRFLKHLNYSWAKLHDVYTKLDIVEICDCINVQYWPACGSGAWRKGED